MARLRTVDEALKAVEKRLRRAPIPEVWAALVSEGRVQQFIREVADGFDDALADLIALIRRDEKLFESARGRSRGVVHVKRRTKKGGPNHESRALMEILALEAEKVPEVHEFRRQHLGGKLLEPNQVEPWVREQWDKQPPPTRYAKAYINDGGKFERRSEFWEHETVWFWDGLRIDGVVINERSPLGHLKRVTSLLGERFGFLEPDSVSFALSGKTPSPAGISFDILPSYFARDADRVVLKVNPAMPPRALLKIYAEARKDSEWAKYENARCSLPLGVATWRDVARAKKSTPPRARRELTSEPRARLAVFAARVSGEGLSWSKAMARWNRNNAGFRYSDVRTFARDVRAAYKRVTGAMLVWKGKDSRPPTTEATPKLTRGF